jgi:5-methylcytosine-specific restriction endonuclease McrA
MKPNHTIKPCERCGAPIKEYRNYPRRFCSHSCEFKTINTKIKPPRYCAYCGAVITKNPKNNARFCSRLCSAKYIGDKMRGKLRPEVTKPNPALRRRVSKFCEVCGKQYECVLSVADESHFCSNACHGKFRSAHSLGNKNPNWKGGETLFYGSNWQQQREAARRRDKYACQRCGISEIELGYELDVHHLQSLRTFNGDWQSANVLDNLLCLCKVCHQIVED